MWFRNRRQRVRLSKLRGDVDPSELDAPRSLSLPESALTEDDDDKETNKSAEALVMAAMMAAPAATKFDPSSLLMARASSPTNSDSPTEIAPTSPPSEDFPLMPDINLNLKRTMSPDSITEVQPSAKVMRPSELPASAQMDARAAHDTFGICLVKAFENIHQPQAQVAPKANLFAPSDPIFDGVANREQSPGTAPCEPPVAAGAGYYMPPTMSEPAPTTQMELLRMQQVVRMQQGLLEMQSRVFSSMMNTGPMNAPMNAPMMGQMNGSVNGLVNGNPMMNAGVRAPIVAYPVESQAQQYPTMQHPSDFPVYATPRAPPAYNNTNALVDLPTTTRYAPTAQRYGVVGRPTAPGAATMRKLTASKTARTLPVPNSSTPGTAPTSPTSSTFTAPVDSADNLFLDDLLQAWE